MKSEFEFIKNLKNNFNLSNIGDDCAVLPKDAETDLLVTTDMLIEDVDFRLDWSSFENIGHKALAVSVSDISAMGGVAKSSLLSIGIPEKIWSSSFVDQFYSGYMTLANELNIELVGGDLSQSPEKVLIDSIVLGEVEKDNAILRSGAKQGDRIFVTGNLGGAGAGLALLESGVRLGESLSTWQKELLLRQLKPYPRIPTNYAKFAMSMIDISDGLSSDLMHLCKASGVGAQIDADRIPLDENLSEFTDSFEDRLDLALNSGEDFELLFTLNPKNTASKYFVEFHEIGEITETVGIIELLSGDNSRILPPDGYSHF